MAKHWHRCERWWVNNLPCPFGGHEGIEEEPEDDRVKSEQVRPALTRQVMRTGAHTEDSRTRAIVMAAITGALAATAGMVKTSMGVDRAGSSLTRPTTFAIAEKLVADTAGKHFKTSPRSGGYGGKLFHVQDFMQRTRKLLEDPGGLTSSIFSVAGWTPDPGAPHTP